MVDKVHMVKSGLDAFNELCDVYTNAHDVHCKVITCEDDLDVESKRYGDKQVSNMEYRIQVQAKERLKIAELQIQKYIM